MEEPNLTYLRELMDDDSAIIVEVLKLFITEVQKDFSAMQDFLLINNFSAISSIAHKLKSSVGNLGMQELKQQFQDIEHMAKNTPDDTLLIQKINDVLAERESMIKAVQAALDKIQ